MLVPVNIRMLTSAKPELKALHGMRHHVECVLTFSSVSDNDSVSCCRTREAAAHDKAAAADAEMREEELQASTAKLQKQLDKVGQCSKVFCGFMLHISQHCSAILHCTCCLC